MITHKKHTRQRKRYETEKKIREENKTRKGERSPPQPIRRNKEEEGTMSIIPRPREAYIDDKAKRPDRSLNEASRLKEDEDEHNIPPPPRAVRTGKKRKGPKQQARRSECLSQCSNVRDKREKRRKKEGGDRERKKPQPIGRRKEEARKSTRQDKRYEKAKEAVTNTGSIPRLFLLHESVLKLPHEYHPLQTGKPRPEKQRRRRRSKNQPTTQSKSKERNLRPSSTNTKLAREHPKQRHEFSKKHPRLRTSTLPPQNFGLTKQSTPNSTRNPVYVHMCQRPKPLIPQHENPKQNRLHQTTSPPNPSSDHTRTTSRSRTCSERLPRTLKSSPNDFHKPNSQTKLSTRVPASRQALPTLEPKTGDNGTEERVIIDSTDNERILPPQAPRTARGRRARKRDSVRLPSTPNSRPNELSHPIYPTVAITRSSELTTASKNESSPPQGDLKKPKRAVSSRKKGEEELETTTARNDFLLSTPAISQKVLQYEPSHPPCSRFEGSKRTRLCICLEWGGMNEDSKAGGGKETARQGLPHA
ncbi:hypothetical protein BJ508DRAFT_341602 [Ascobolus immersus RN42]|uniref:Uncharacterized protein n=1 Tax=Ascobolus immersus RN42 TaxID=1160509 RepID=A0A3N4HJ11_ASCIM|nr:hypothetical protein BJ508DRAFT_341602 [Ascobolus immersus RN42]